MQMAGGATQGPTVEQFTKMEQRGHNTEYTLPNEYMSSMDCNKEMDKRALKLHYF